MSVPFTEFSCDSCDYNGASTVLWGEFTYSAAGRDAPIKRALGWCAGCRGLAPIEVLGGADRIAALENEISLKTSAVREFVDRADAGRGPLARIFRRPVEVPEDIREIDHHVRIARRELEDEKARAALLAGRRAGPRCLFCGSTEVERFPEGYELGGDPRRPGPPVATGWAHPGCGGQLHAKWSEVWIAMRRQARRYTPEGEPIEPDARDSLKF